MRSSSCSFRSGLDGLLVGFADGFAICPDAGLAACGDWCWRGGVEAAFNSANALTDELLRSVG